MAGKTAIKSKEASQTEQSQSRQSSPERRSAETRPYDALLSLQRSAGNGAVKELIESSLPRRSAPPKQLPSIVKSALNANYGQPLEPRLRAEMESSLREDF